jgi:hypothetical protein
MRQGIQPVRLVAAAVVTGALLVPLVIFAGTGFAKSPSAAQYEYKITICHHTHSTTNPSVTISVSVRAWPAHKKHGDSIGACLPPTTTTTANAIAPPANAASSNGHGNGGHNSSGHGNSDGHGNGHGK